MQGAYETDIGKLAYIGKQKVLCLLSDRRVVIMGKRLQELINYVIDNGYVSFDKSRIGSLNNINDKDAVILISNENEKPFSNLRKNS